MRIPMPGVLPPLARTKITPAPPIGEHEKAVVVSPRRKYGNNEPAPVTCTPAEGGSVVLENLKDKFTPYLLLIVERNAHETAAQVYDALRVHLASKKD